MFMLSIESSRHTSPGRGTTTQLLTRLRPPHSKTFGLPWRPPTGGTSNTSRKCRSKACWKRSSLLSWTVHLDACRVKRYLPTLQHTVTTIAAPRGASCLRLLWSPSRFICISPNLVVEGRPKDRHDISNAGVLPTATCPLYTSPNDSNGSRTRKCCR